MPMGMFTLAAQAELVTGVFCGDILEWMPYDDGILIISGTGDMTNYVMANYAPWYSYQLDIKNVIIGNGIC